MNEPLINDAILALMRLSRDCENRNGCKPRIAWDGVTLHLDERPAASRSFDALDSEIAPAVASGEPGPVLG